MVFNPDIVDDINDKTNLWVKDENFLEFCEILGKGLLNKC